MSRRLRARRLGEKAHARPPPVCYKSGRPPGESRRGQAVIQTDRMNSSSATYPTQKSVVLVGAGNAHLVFVRRWGMRPVPGVAVTLVNEALVVPYSAMVPAHLARRLLLGRDHHRPRPAVPGGPGSLCGGAGDGFGPCREKGPPRRPAAAGLRSCFSRPRLAAGPVPPVRPMPAPRGHAAAGDAPARESTAWSRTCALAAAFHFVVVGGGASGCELATGHPPAPGRLSRLPADAAPGTRPAAPGVPTRRRPGSSRKSSGSGASLCRLSSPRGGMRRRVPPAGGRRQDRLRRRPVGHPGGPAPAAPRQRPGRGRRRLPAGPRHPAIARRPRSLRHGRLRRLPAYPGPAAKTASTPSARARSCSTTWPPSCGNNRCGRSGRSASACAC